MTKYFTPDWHLNETRIGDFNPFFRPFKNVQEQNEIILKNLNGIVKSNDELFHLWGIFNTIATCVVVPTILSLYWKRLSARGVIWGILVAFVIGLPAFVYGNYVGDNVLIVVSSVFIILVSTLFCLLMPKKYSTVKEAEKLKGGFE